MQRDPPAHQEPAPAAGQVPRPHRPGNQIPQALRRSHHERRVALHLRGAQPPGPVHQQLHDKPRLPGSRNADDAPRPRRRRGQALHDPPQCAGHGTVPAHRARALPEAVGGGRLREGLRGQSQLPQRGHQHPPQPRIHHDGVLRGLRELQEPHGFHRRPAAPLRPRGPGHGGVPVPRARAGSLQALRPSDHRRGHPQVPPRLHHRPARRRRLAQAEDQGFRRGGQTRRPGQPATPALRGLRRGPVVGAHLHHRLPGGGLAARPRLRRQPRDHRALRALHRRPRDRQRLLRAERPGRPGRPLPGAGRRQGSRRRGGHVLRCRLHPRPGIRPAPHRRLWHRHRPPGDAAHRQPGHPRRDPLPAHAAGVVGPRIEEGARRAPFLSRLRRDPIPPDAGPEPLLSHILMVSSGGPGAPGARNHSQGNPVEASTLDADEKFYSSSKSRLAKTRLWLWLGLGSGLVMVAARYGGQSLAFPAVLSLAIVLAVELLTRKAMKKGQALVTLTEEGIESPLFPAKHKRLRWQDITECKVEWVQGIPHLQFLLAPSSGIPDRRSFWNGVNRARPRIALAAFAPETQERLVNAVLGRLGHCAAGADAGTGTNAITAEREFQASLKALASIPWATYALIAANILVWLTNLALGANLAQTPVDKLLDWGGNSASEVQRGEWWRLLTATFLHGGLVHLAMNMIGLVSAGVMVERIYGHRLFALIYLGSGLTGSAMGLHFAAQHAVSVGASGAVFGVTGALLVAVLQHRDTLPKAFGKQTLSGVGFFILYALLQGFAKQGIDNGAHVGGLVGGCLLAYVLPERFDMERFNRQVRHRAKVAAAIAVAATLALAASAPPAAVDLSGRLTGAAFAVKGLQGFAAAFQALQREHEDVLAGKLTEREADERSRSIHAPQFRAVLDDLARASLPPGDPRGPILADMRRFTELLLEALAMPSHIDPESGKITPSDPRRFAAIQAEMVELAEHVQKAAKELKAGTPR